MKLNEILNNKAKYTMKMVDYLSFTKKVMVKNAIKEVCEVIECYVAPLERQISELRAEVKKLKQD